MYRCLSTTSVESSTSLTSPINQHEILQKLGKLGSGFIHGVNSKYAIKFYTFDIFVDIRCPIYNLLINKLIN